MKVGVVTFHSANNYGAILQTWALQKVLKDMGMNSGIINYHPDIIDGLYDPMQLKEGLERQIKKSTLYIRNRKSLIRYNKFRSFLRENYNLIGDYRTYDELKSAKFNLDAYITGSDQVWNPTHIGGYDPAYFLEFAAQGKKKISYAASLGTDYIDSRYKDDIERALSTFTSISIREKSAKPAVEELVEGPVEVVLDPTLLLKKEDYDEIKVRSKIKEPYILVYAIERNPELAKFANKISVALGLPLIQRRPGLKLVNELEPFYTADTGEFLGLVESAEYVITNSFHGTVFALLYGKPFVSMLHSDTGSRTEDLLQQLDLSSHILYDLEDFDDFNIFRYDDVEDVRRRIEELKESSLDFLKEALGVN